MTGGLGWSPKPFQLGARAGLPTEIDRAKRKPIYADLQKLLNEEVPFYSTQYWTQLLIASKRMHNSLEAAGVYNYSQPTWMKDVWVDDGK